MTPQERLEAALETATPIEAAHGLAIALKSEGLQQEELLGVFDQVRSTMTGGEGPRYDAVLDAMDRIAGWCSPELALFPDSAQEDE